MTETKRKFKSGAQSVKVEGVANAVQEHVKGPLLVPIDHSKVMGKSPVNCRLTCIGLQFFIFGFLPQMPAWL